MSTTQPRSKLNPVDPDTAEAMLGVWRERIFFSVFASTLALIIVPFVFSTIQVLRDGLWGNLIVYTVNLICLIGILVLRRVPFRVRTVAGLTTFYTFGLVALVSVGASSSGRVWLLAFSVIATLLLGLRAGLITLLINSFTVFFLGYLSGNALVDLQVAAGLPARLWTIVSVTFVFLNAILTISLGVLVRNLEQGLIRTHRLTESLRKTNAELEEDRVRQRELEHNLSKSEEKFRTFVENANDIIYQLSPDGEFTYASPNWVEILGYGLDEVIGETVDEFVHPDDVQICNDFLNAVISTGEKQSGVEYRVRHKDGGWRWHSSSGAPVKDANGRSVSYIGVARDITKIKEEEEARIALHQRYQTVVKNFPNGAVFLFDKEMKYVHVEGKALGAVGLMPAEMIGKTVKEIFPPEVSSVAYKNQQLLFEGKTCYYEVEFAGRIYANWGEPVINNENQIQEGVVFAVDITGRKQAEEALRESERKHRLLADNTVDVIWLMDMNLRFVYVNPAIFALTGYTVAEWEGTRLPDHCDAEAFGQMAGIIAAEVAKGPQQEGVVFASEMRRKDGTAIAVEIHGKVIFDGAGAPQFLQGVTRDMSERKAAEEERERLRGQLQQAQKMDSIGRLAGGVAHDFNNMLNVIIGHCDLMAYELPDDSPLRADLEEIRKAADRSANLTRQLLAFARKQTVAPKVLDLNESVSTMLKMLQRLIGEDIDLLWKPEPSLASVRIDPGQVDQMLANLAVNARDAIGHAHGKITIETANVRFDEDYCADHAGFTPGAYVLLAVSDDGCGMDEETRAKIFEPFFTTKGVGEGTGLGLATIYGVVKQNDGFVNVYSELGQGTTFRIYLPALSAPPAPSASAEIDSSAAETGDETILIVEDQPALLEMAQTMLARRGYTVLTAGKPSEALRLAQEQSGGIDLLITDVVMPEMNGRALAEKLQALCPSLKTVFMSGYTADVIAHQGVLEAGVHYLEKPFSQQELSRMVRAVLDS